MEQLPFTRSGAINGRSQQYQNCKNDDDKKHGVTLIMRKHGRIKMSRRDIEDAALLKGKLTVHTSTFSTLVTPASSPNILHRWGSTKT